MKIINFYNKLKKVKIQKKKFACGAEKKEKTDRRSVSFGLTQQTTSFKKIPPGSITVTYLGLWLDGCRFYFKKNTPLDTLGRASLGGLKPASGCCLVHPVVSLYFTLGSFCFDCTIRSWLHNFVWGFWAFWISKNAITAFFHGQMANFASSRLGLFRSGTFQFRFSLWERIYYCALVVSICFNASRAFPLWRITVLVFASGARALPRTRRIVWFRAFGAFPL